MAFDFNDWMNLARNNPAEFEQKRHEVIEALIAQSPPEIQQKLHCLQWRVDMERRRSGDAMSSCTRIYSMMWSFVYDDGGLLDKLNLVLQAGNQDRVINKPVKSAKILAFRS